MAIETKVRQIVQIPDSLKEVMEYGDAADSAMRKLGYPNYSMEPRIPAIITTEEQISFQTTEQHYDKKNGKVIQDEYMGSDVTGNISQLPALAERKWDVDKVIECYANPKVVDWSLPKREAIQKTKAGSVRYTWPRGRGKNRTYYDEFPVAFTFQSGPTFTRQDGEFEGRAPPGLVDFYKFIRILNEPKLMSNGDENLHVVMHTSPTFPILILKGWFSAEGVRFNESAEGNHSIEWNATMEVHKTVPHLWDLDALKRVFGTYTE